VAAAESGIWRLFGFEDPITVVFELPAATSTAAFAISGRGCDAGYFGLAPGPTTIDEGGPCDAVVGTGSGSHLQFGIRFGSGPSFSADVYVSKDRTRMAGAFLDGGQVFNEALGWYRLEPYIDPTIALSGGVRLPRQDLGPFAFGMPAWDTTINGHAFALQGDAAVGAIVPGRTYSPAAHCFGYCYLKGELGAFWDPDFHWDASTRNLTLGPAPETIPGMPVKLRFQYDIDERTVIEVGLTAPDGTTGIMLPVN
jgi:hypothetical protein